MNDLTTKRLALITDERFANQVAAMLPKHLTPERFIRICCTAVTRLPKLAECDAASFFGALQTLSQLGLEPDGRRAHLIPFFNRKRGTMECTLIIDYKGLVELVKRDGKYKVYADVVRANDKFSVNVGHLVEHRIDWTQSLADRGDIIAAYAMAWTDDRRNAEGVTLAREEIDAVRARSKSPDSGPWVTDYAEMAKKTAFRRLSKWLVLGPELRDAIEADDPDLRIEPPPAKEVPLFTVQEQEQPQNTNDSNEQSTQ
jgi:recombination protein RecT